MKILIVDDSNTFRQKLSSFFEDENYNVVEACNGKEALDYVLEKCTEKTDAIISDVNMPVMDGITMCKRLKDNKIIEHIPVVMLTSECDAEIKSQAKDLGVKAWVKKPIELEFLLDVIRKVIK